MGFKIFFDVSKVNLGVLLEKLKKIGNIIYVNSDLYIWLYEGKDKKSLSSAIKRAGVADFYLQEITEDNVNKETGFAFAWCREHLNEASVSSFESKHQEELQEMLDNIKKADQLLQEKIEQAKALAIAQNNKEDESDGG